MVQNNHKFDNQTIVCEMHMGRQFFFYLRSQSHMMTHVNQVGFPRPHSIDDSQRIRLTFDAKDGAFSAKHLRPIHLYLLTSHIPIQE